MLIYNGIKISKQKISNHNEDFKELDIIWKSILVGQMVRLFWVNGTVREFEG